MTNSVLAEILSRHCSERGPGAQLLVLAGGEQHTHARGLANLEHGIGWSGGASHRIASLSKHIVAIALLAALKRSGGNLETKVRDLASELPSWCDGVSVRQLLNCTAGLRGDEALAWLGGHRTDSPVSSRYLERLVQRQSSPNWAPGAVFQYSDTGFRLAARLLEGITGERLNEWTRRELFAPLGMTATFFSETDADVISQLATTYCSGGGRLGRYFGLMSSSGDGAGVSSLRDMAIWMRALMDNKLPVDVSVEELLERPVLAGGRQSHYGLGLHVGQHRGRRWLGHSGVLFSYCAMRVFPEERVAILSLGNSDAIDQRRLVHEVADAALGGEFAEELEEAYCAFRRSKPQAATRWVDAARGYCVSLRRGGDVIELDWLGVKAYLRECGPGDWRAESGAMSVGLRRVSAARVEIDLGDGKWLRFAPVRRASAASAGLAGVYWSDDICAAMHVDVEDGDLRVLVSGGPTSEHEQRLQSVGEGVWCSNKLALFADRRTGTGLSVHTGTALGVQYRRLA